MPYQSSSIGQRISNDNLSAQRSSSFGGNFPPGNFSPHESNNSLPSPHNLHIDPPDTSDTNFRGKSPSSDHNFGSNQSTPTALSPVESRAGIGPAEVKDEVQRDAEGYTIPPPPKELGEEPFDGDVLEDTR